MAIPLPAIIAIVVIIIVAGGFFALKSRNSQTMDAPAASAPSMDAPAASAPSMDAPAASAPMPAAAPTPMPGLVISHGSVYETGARVITVVPDDVKATLNNVAAYLKEKNITVPYNYVTTFSDGGFRLYNVPAGATPVTGPFTHGPGLTVTTYSVPGGISVSTFASISHFGKSGGGMMMILIILLLAGGLYYLHTQGKLKMPTFNQRMAEFGRTIKSLRKM
jgi:hypothetical protein